MRSITRGVNVPNSAKRFVRYNHKRNILKRMHDESPRGTFRFFPSHLTFSRNFEKTKSVFSFSQCNSIKRMNQVNTQRDQLCAQSEDRGGHPPTWAAVQWLRENKDRFKGKVYEPARFSIFPKREFKGQQLNTERDKDLLNMIEGPISKDAFRVSFNFILFLIFIDLN